MDAIFFNLADVERFLLIFFRFIGFIAVFPFFSASMFPVFLKVGLAFALSIIVFPFVDLNLHIVNITQLLLYSSLETLIGITIGFIASIILYGASLAGNIIDMQSSFMMANQFDPFFFVSNTITGEFLFLFFILIYIFIGGLDFLIQTAVYSFKVINVLNLQFLNGGMYNIIVNTISFLFVIGIKFAAPILTALVVTNVVLSILARTVPQLNIFIVGMPLKIGTSFIFIIFSIPMIAWIFKNNFDWIKELLLKSLHVMGGF